MRKSRLWREILSYLLSMWEISALPVVIASSAASLPCFLTLEYLVEETGQYLTLWLGLEAGEASMIKEVKAAPGPKLMRFLNVDLAVPVVESAEFVPDAPERTPE